MKIIAFSGSMGSGKSTAIQFLEDFENKQIICIKFAAPLYDMQEFIYRRIKTVYNRPENFVKDRKLLQWLGTEWGRETINDSIWIDIWKESVLDANRNNPKAIIVCDDCRFNNEAQIVQSLGGYVVKIDTDNNKDRITTANGIVNHSSELGIDNKYIDFMLSNNDTILEFGTNLRKIFEIIEDHYNERANISSAI